MSKHTDQSTATPNATHPDEAKYIKNMAALLSEESGIEKDWIANILLLTKPRNLLSLIGSKNYKEYPAQILYQFRPCLFDAMRWLDQERVKEFFSGDLSHLSILETNYSQLLKEIPFVEFKSMLKMADEFKTYLEEESKSIIKTGNPSRHFEKSFYLESTFLSSFSSRLPDSILKRSKNEYLDRQSQFEDGMLSSKFLAKILGPEYYREFIEIEENPTEIFNPVQSARTDDLRKRLKSSLSSTFGFHPTAALKHYLKENKLRIPADLDDRDEAFRASLHLLSQKAFKEFVAVYRDRKEGNLLSEIWKLIYALPNDHLDLIFNGHLGYFGLGKYDFGGETLYNFGQNLLLKILTAAALADESNGKIIGKIRSALGPVVEDFIDADTGNLKPITYSIYQAIDLAVYTDIVSACGQLQQAKQHITAIKSSLKREAKRTLEYSFDQLKAQSDRALLASYLSRTGGVDDIKTLTSLRDAHAIRERFDEGFAEYRCLNSSYGIFDFSTEARTAAISLMFKNYQAGEHRTSVRELAYAIYSAEDAEAKLMLKGNSIWRLEKGPFKGHPAIKYGMIRAGARKQGLRAYILDFSFEDRSPDEQLKYIKSEHKKRDNEIKETHRKKIANKDSKRKLREAEEAAGTRRRFGDMGGGKKRDKS